MANGKRLIDAGDLWSDIMMLPHNGDMVSSEEVEQAIKEAPTVDAVEVVHGRWDKPSKYGLGHKFNHLGAVCSACACYCNNLYNYCPHCGAKMDLEDRKNATD